MFLPKPSISLPRVTKRQSESPGFWVNKLLFFYLFHKIISSRTVLHFLPGIRIKHKGHFPLVNHVKVEHVSKDNAFLEKSSERVNTKGLPWITLSFDNVLSLFLHVLIDDNYFYASLATPKFPDVYFHFRLRRTYIISHPTWTDIQLCFCFSLQYILFVITDIAKGVLFILFLEHWIWDKYYMLRNGGNLLK